MTIGDRRTQNVSREPEQKAEEAYSTSQLVREAQFLKSFCSSCRSSRKTRAKSIEELVNEIQEFYEASLSQFERIKLLPKTLDITEKGRTLKIMEDYSEEKLNQLFLRMHSVGLLTDSNISTLERKNLEQKKRVYRGLGNQFVNAAECGSVSVIKQFLKGKFPINFQDLTYKSTALHEAADSGDIAVADVLLETGECDLLIKDNEGATPAMLAKMGLMPRGKVELGERLEKLTCEASGLSMDEYREQTQQAIDEIRAKRADDSQNLFHNASKILDEYGLNSPA